MKIKKGQKVRINHSRKGRFNGIARESFDTEKDEDEWYPIDVDGETVYGKTNAWQDGEEIPCKAKFCKVFMRE